MPTLGFSRTHWRNSTSSQRICSDIGFCPYHQCAQLCQPPLPGLPVSSQKSSALFLAPNLCRNSSPTEAISSCRVLLPSGGRQAKTGGPSSASTWKQPGVVSPELSLMVQQVLEQWERYCRLLASVLLCSCVQTWPRQ